MEMTKIKINKTEIELLEYIPDFYSIAEITNPLLSEMRPGIKTWVSEDVFEKMQVSIWIVNDIRVNAFAKRYEGKNYIVLTIGLCVAFWKEVEEFIGNKNFRKVFHLSEEKEDSYKKELYQSMLNFIIAHEFGHIVHGHVLANSEDNFIEELYADETTNKDNWLTQLREFDADYYAAMLNTAITLGYWKEDRKVLSATFDLLFLSFYLCFDVFAKNSNRDFSNYQEKDIESYDHPYPGIRMYYCSIAICDLLIRIKGDNELIRELISSGFDAMISYEKRALGKEKYRDSYFSIAGTQKGAMHIRALVNGWNELVDEYNRYSYVTIYKNDNVESLSYFLGEDGEFLRQGV